MVEKTVIVTREPKSIEELIPLVLKLELPKSRPQLVEALRDLANSIEVRHDEYVQLTLESEKRAERNRQEKLARDAAFKADQAERAKRYLAEKEANMASPPRKISPNPNGHWDNQSGH